MLRTKEVSGCGECTPAMDLPGWSAGEFSSRVLGNSAPESQGIQLQNPWEFSSRVPGNSAPESPGIQPQSPWEFSPRFLGNSAPESLGMQPHSPQGCPAVPSCFQHTAPALPWLWCSSAPLQQQYNIPEPAKRLPTLLFTICACLAPHTWQFLCQELVSQVRPPWIHLSR